MSFSLNTKIARSLYTTLSLVLLNFVLAGAAKAMDSATCGEVFEVDLTVHSVVSSHATHCFETYAPATGFLMVEVSIPAWSHVEPRLDVFGQDESAQVGSTELAYLERSPTSALLHVQAPGHYLVCVDAQQPGLSLEAYKVAIGVAAVRPAYPPAVKGGDPEEDEPDPDTAPLRLGCSAASTARRAARELCRRSLMDDHGDTTRCATRVQLGQELSAEIRNDLGDDDDFFVFTLEELQTVKIETAGDLDTFGGIYDRRGYRLKTADDGGEGGNFSIVKTLSPGKYYVRVESRDGSEGLYRLIVHTAQP